MVCADGRPLAQRRFMLIVRPRWLLRQQGDLSSCNEVYCYIRYFFVSSFAGLVWVYRSNKLANATHYASNKHCVKKALGSNDAHAEQSRLAMTIRLFR